MFPDKKTFFRIVRQALECRWSHDDKSHARQGECGGRQGAIIAGLSLDHHPTRQAFCRMSRARQNSKTASAPRTDSAMENAP